MTRLNGVLITARLQQHPPPLRTVVPDIAPVLADVIERRLAREPGRRLRATDVASILAAASR